MKRSHHEWRLQCAIVDTARLCATSSVLILSIANQRATSAADVGREIRAGMLPGAPDLIVAWRDEAMGRSVTLGMEVKTPRGRLSEAQLAFTPRAERAGWVTVVVRSVDEAMAALAELGCPMRRSYEPGRIRLVGAA